MAERFKAVTARLEDGAVAPGVLDTTTGRLIGFLEEYTAQKEAGQCNADPERFGLFFPELEGSFTIIKGGE